MKFTDIIEFWFHEIQPKDWWVKDHSFDKMIRERFLDIHAQAARCELYEWRQEPLGRLAEIIILDQFSRNMFRDQPEAFANDSLALSLAQEAVAGEHNQKLNTTQKSFLYMPYMHSESKLIHEVALKLFEDTPDNLDFEIKHKNIIDRFGRYPHRNKLLNRVSTPEEITFLQGPNSSF